LRQPQRSFSPIKAVPRPNPGRIRTASHRRRQTRGAQIRMGNRNPGELRTVSLSRQQTRGARPHSHSHNHNHNHNHSHSHSHSRHLLQPLW